MATITLYSNFNKKLNSTKRPTSGVDKYVVFKEATSLDKPVFILESYDSSWNYCKYLNRYYYIVDVVYTSDKLIDLHCSTDVLATYKDEILKVDCNILYCDGSTKNLVDHRIPILATSKVAENYKAIDGLTITGYDNQGAVIIGITGKGSFGSYLMQDSTQINDLLDGVADWNTTNITDTLTGLQQLIYGGTASECLKSAIALPLLIDGSKLGSEASDLYLGNYPCTTSSYKSIKGYQIKKPILTYTTTIDIPWPYDDWRRTSPYCEVIIYLPFIGTIQMPTTAMVDDNQLIIQYSVNVTSGDIAVQYKGKSTNRIYGTASTNIAMATPFGSTGVDTNKLTTAIVTGLGTMLSAIPPTAVAGLTTSTALSLSGGLAASTALGLSALGGTGSGSGGLGGGATQGLDRVIHCYVVYRELVNAQSTYNPIMGKPFMAIDKISNHVGFVMTEGFSVNIAGLGNDKDIINKFMDSGVYIE